MPYDRARRPGEDIIQFAVETQRIAAAASDDWRRMLGPGGASEKFVENLATPLPPDPNSPAVQQTLSAAQKPSAALTAKVRATLNLPASATGAEVLAAVEKLRKPAASSRPVAVPVAAATQEPQTFVNSALNPAVYDLAASAPQSYRDALQASGGTVPGLFGPGRDLPDVTASGIAPSRLAEVPWQARPAIAAATDPTEAQELLQLASGPDGAAAVSNLPEFDHPGVRNYLDEVRMFAAAGDAVARRRGEDQQIAAARQQQAQFAAAAGTEPSDDAVFDAVFGGLMAHEERLAELRGRNAR